MRKKSNKYGDREGVVFSTDPNFVFISSNEEESLVTLPAAQQNFYVKLDKKARAGKQVTLVNGFVGTEDDLNTLAKKIKTLCAVGGSVKEQEIIIQGDFKQKIYEFLLKQGYKAKLVG